MSVPHSPAGPTGPARSARSGRPDEIALHPAAVRRAAVREPGARGAGARATAVHAAPTGRPPGLEDLPPVPDPRGMAPGDARELSKVLFVRLRAVDEGGPEYSYVRGTLIELNLSLVRFAAGRFRGRSESMEDILQVGTVGLIKAIDRFAPERDVEFSTYALPTITGEIKRFFRDTSWAVHVPRRLQELRLSLARATDVLEQDLERAPTVRELAEHLRLEEEEVVEGLGASNAYTAGSLDAQTQADGAEGSIADRLGRPDDAMDAVEDLESLRPLIARLPERERAILSLRFVGDMTQSEIGRRLGMSQMHVSRLLSHALRSLREGLLCEE